MEEVSLLKMTCTSVIWTLTAFWKFMITRVALEFDEAFMSGVACDLDSPGFHALCKATEEVVGHVKPYSITGSLPLIRELQV